MVLDSIIIAIYLICVASGIFGLGFFAGHRYAINNGEIEEPEESTLRTYTITTTTVITDEDGNMVHEEETES